MKEINVIVPTYNIGAKIEPLIESLYKQTIRDKIQLTIIDDCSTEGMSEMFTAISKWVDKLSIDLSTCGENVGPGAARSIGLKQSNSPYVVFADSDDIFKDPKSIELLYNAMTTRDSLCMVSAGFDEEFEDGSVKYHPPNYTWLFGKMYKREFLLDNGIDFSDSRANEDVGFNVKCFLCVDSPIHNILTLDKPVYIWKYNKDSITRRDNGSYNYALSCAGYLDNITHAVDHAYHRDDEHPNYMRIMDKVLEAMVESFTLFKKTAMENPDDLEDVVDSIRLFVVNTFNTYWGAMSFETNSLIIHLMSRNCGLKCKDVSHAVLEFTTFVKSIQYGATFDELKEFFGVNNA